MARISSQETIDICMSELYKGQQLVNNLSQRQMKSLLELAVNESVFLFNNTFYKQVDGL